jgi:hypothetical protein
MGRVAARVPMLDCGWVSAEQPRAVPPAAELSALGELRYRG